MKLLILCSAADPAPLVEAPALLVEAGGSISHYLGLQRREQRAIRATAETTLNKHKSKPNSK